jgi:aminopeptidase N
MKHPIAPAFFLALFSLAAYADNYSRQPGLDVEHYVFRIALDDAAGEIAGETTVSVRFFQPGLGAFWLDLASPSQGKGMTVDGVTSAAAAVSYTHADGRLRIALAPPPSAGELRRYTVRYHGVPADGFHLVKNKFGESTFFSNNWPDLAHQWLPTIDHPYDKASSEFFVTASARYQVVANGMLVEQLDLGGGRRTTHWSESVPIATWLNNIGVAEFSSRRFGTAAGVPLEIWVFPRDREAGMLTFEEASRESIEFYRDRIGPYPYEKLANVEAAGMGGAMENASAIFYAENHVDGRPALHLVSHEVAHQWFGNSVTEKDWDDVWLSEGFATYFALLTTEHYEGRDAFQNGLKEARERVFTAEKRLPGVAVVQDKPWTGIPNAVVYQKGAWVLHMLRGQIGEEKFWAGIREYYRRFRDGNASTADFAAVMEEAADQDLRWFFGQWLYHAGSPVVESTWRYNPATKKIELDLEQTQPGFLYRLPLEIAIDSSPNPEKIELNQRRQRFEISCAKSPTSVELDPHTWLLMDARSAGK